MKYLIALAVMAAGFTSCSNNADETALFCDTACRADSIKYVGDHKLQPMVAISFSDCKPDSLTWHHYLMDFSKTVELSSFLGQEVRVNQNAMDCFINDTTEAWLTFNDCLTGRGYLLKLPYSENGSIGKYTGAITNFDPKYNIDPDLRAYTDRGSIFVINIKTGEEAIMSFKEAYDIDFNKLHEIVDSVSVTKERIYVELIKNGQEVKLDKSIKL